MWAVPLRDGGGSEELVLIPSVVVFGPVLPARMVHGDTRTAPITPGSRSKNTARGTYLPPEALAVKYIDAAELRVVVVAVLAVAADAVLVAQHLLKLGAHLATALARLHARNFALRRGAALSLAAMYCQRLAQKRSFCRGFATR